MTTAIGRRLGVVAVAAACFGAGPLAASAPADECPPAGCSETVTIIEESDYIDHWGPQDDAVNQGYDPAPLPEPILSAPKRKPAPRPEPAPARAPAPTPKPAPAPASAPEAPAAGPAPQHPAPATSEDSHTRVTGTAPAVGDPDVPADVPAAARSSLPSQPPSPSIRSTEAAPTPERLDTNETVLAAAGGGSGSIPVAGLLSALALTGVAVGGVLHRRRRSRSASPEV